MLQPRGLHALLPHRRQVSQQLAQQLAADHGADAQLARGVDPVLVGDDGGRQRARSLRGRGGRQGREMEQGGGGGGGSM